MKDDQLYLLHIQECIARIEQYTVGGKDAFLASTLIQDAVLRNLQTLAESTKRLSDGFKGNYPNVDWRKIAGFRNVLVHDYLRLDMERIWEILEEDLPSLKTKLQPAVREPKKPTARRRKEKTTAQAKRSRKKKK